MRCKLCNRKFVRFEFTGETVFTDVCDGCLKRYRDDKSFNWKAAVQSEWTEDDWRDFYHAVDFALWRIARRHNAQQALDFQI